MVAHLAVVDDFWIGTLVGGDDDAEDAELRPEWMRANMPPAVLFQQCREPGLFVLVVPDEALV